MTNVHDQFTVDWAVNETNLRPDAAVAVRNHSRKIGLYRVKHVARGRMILSHGGISFPVGTQLTLEDYQGLLPQSGHPLNARVVENNLHGIHVAW
jgi:hypothetical protein